MVNNLLQQSGKAEKFNVKLIGVKKEMKLNDGIFTIQADITTDELKEIDVIIIPPMSGDIADDIHLNRDYIPRSIQKYNRRAEVASLCIVSFL